MKIQFCSDLHIEFEKNELFLKSNPIIKQADILVLVGDVYSQLTGGKINQYFFDNLSEQFEKVYWIPGNHEFYHGDDYSKYEFINKPIRDNVFIVNNQVINIGDVDLILSTLWTEIAISHIGDVVNGMADFSRIKIGKKHISFLDYGLFHKTCLNFIKKSISESKNKKVIFTHHCPSELCNHEEYKNSVLNSGFVVDLTNYIKYLDIDYWIYGHTHKNMPDTKIGKCSLQTNQLGYVDHREHYSYQNFKVIDI